MKSYYNLGYLFHYRQKLFHNPFYLATIQFHIDLDQLVLELLSLV